MDTCLVASFFCLPSDIGLQLSNFFYPLKWLLLSQTWALSYQYFINFSWNHLCVPPCSPCAFHGWHHMQAHIHHLQFFSIFLPCSSDLFFPAPFLPLPSSLSPCSGSYPSVRFMHLTPISCFPCPGCLQCPVSGVGSPALWPPWKQPQRPC